MLKMLNFQPGQRGTQPMARTRLLTPSEGSRKAGI